MVLAGSITSYVLAAESLEALVGSGQYQAAYELALTQEAELAGEPEFDFLFGLSALESGHPQQAIFALERVIAVVPEDHRARLELARAYFVLGNFEKAESLFNAVLASDPPPKVKQNVQLFLDEIHGLSKKRDHFLSANAELRLGYDTNVNSATAIYDVFLPIGILLHLSENSRELDDTFAEINASASYVKLLRKDMGYFLSASFSDRHNSTYNLFDTRFVGLNGGYLYQSRGQSLRIPLQIQYLEIARYHFRTSTGLGLEWSMAPTRAAQFVFFGQWAMLRHTEVEKVRDVDLGLLGFGVSREIFRANTMLNLSVFHAVESPQETGGSHFGRSYTGLRLSAVWRPFPLHELLFGAATQTSQHDSVHPTFGETREDDYSQVALDWMWLLRPRWRLNVGIAYYAVDSNIEIYTYQRSSDI